MPGAATSSMSRSAPTRDSGVRWGYENAFLDCARYRVTPAAIGRPSTSLRLPLAWYLALWHHRSPIRDVSSELCANLKLLLGFKLRGSPVSFFALKQCFMRPMAVSVENVIHFFLTAVTFLCIIPFPTFFQFAMRVPNVAGVRTLRAGTLTIPQLTSGSLFLFFHPVSPPTPRQLLGCERHNPMAN